MQPINFKSPYEFLNFAYNCIPNPSFDFSSYINDLPRMWQIRCARHCPMLINYISNGKEEVCQNVIEYDPLNWRYLPENLKTPELCRLAVALNGRVLQFIPDHMKTPELCLAAVKQCGKAIEYVPEHLKTFSLFLDLLSPENPISGHKKDV